MNSKVDVPDSAKNQFQVLNPHKNKIRKKSSSTKKSISLLFSFCIKRLRERHLRRSSGPRCKLDSEAHRLPLDAGRVRRARKTFSFPNLCSC